MSDPLTLLREYNVSKKEIIEYEEQIIFGEMYWLKNAKTNYLICGTGKSGVPNEYYTLESLLYLLKHKRLRHTAYVRQATAERIPVVRRPDRKDVLAYLNGEKDTSVSIVKYAPLEMPTRVKRVAEESLEHGTLKNPRLQESDMHKIKEQLAAKLDTPIETPVSVKDVNSLLEAMSVEEVTAIKAKRLAKKRTTIKDQDDVEMDSDLRVTTAMEVDGAENIAIERQWRTRTTILQSSGKIFANNIFAILKNIEAREHCQKRSMVQTPTVTPRNMPMRPLPQPAVYNRYGQEKFNQQEKETEGFKINTTATYHGVPWASITEGVNPAIRKSAQVPKETNATSSALPTSAAKLTLQELAQSKRPSTIPIIIIPSINTSLITMYNAQDILQDLKFISNEEKRALGSKREKDILLQRPKVGGLTVPYRVIDNPQKLTKADWDRVVAVFVLGPTWQFKGWPFDGNPVEIFSKVCAFHLKYDEMKLDTNISRWDVTVIELSRTKKHLDRASIMRFWEVLDKHLIKNKAHLRF